MSIYKEQLCINCKYKDNCIGEIVTICTEELTTIKCDNYKTDKVFIGHIDYLDERKAKKL